MAASPGPSEKTRRVPLVAGGVMCVALVVLLVLVSSGTVSGACRDDLAFTGPDADVAVSHDEETGDVFVTYREGEQLTADRTDELFVSIRATDSDNSSRYPLAATSDAFPISAGDRFTLRHATVDDRALTDGDVESVVWRGSENPLPSYCLVDRDAGPSSMLLERDVVG